MVATYVVVASIMRSRTGLAFIAIHDNETVAAAAGVSVVRYRLLAMTAGGYIAGPAGAINSHTLTRHISPGVFGIDRKSTRLNSSHLVISYAVFCLKKKKKIP